MATRVVQVVDVLQDVFDTDAHRWLARTLPPEPPPCPRRASDFEKIFIY